MRLLIPQITWHGGEYGKNAPILSLDFHPRDPRLVVTAGSDSEARVTIAKRGTLVFLVERMIILVSLSLSS
jgi:hypothetical protein